MIDLVAGRTLLRDMWQLGLCFINLSICWFFWFANWLSWCPVWCIPHGTVTVGERDFVGFRVSKPAHMVECNACIRIVTETCADLFSELHFEFFQLRDLVKHGTRTSAMVSWCSCKCDMIDLVAARTLLRDMWQLGLCFINLSICWLFLVRQLAFLISRLVHSAWNCHGWDKRLCRI